MNIIQASDVPQIERPDGSIITYYLFKDYEMMHTIVPPHSTQTWHHYDIIGKTIYVVEGEITALWRDESGEEHRRVLGPGSLIESERTVHTYSNDADQPVVTICVKRIPQEGDHHKTFKTDKILD